MLGSLDSARYVAVEQLNLLGSAQHDLCRVEIGTEPAAVGTFAGTEHGVKFRFGYL